MHDSRTSLLVPRWLLPLAAVTGALALLAIPTIDLPLARWLATRDTHPAVWDAGLHALEYVALLEPWKWLGVIVLAAGAIAGVLTRRHRAWIVIAATHLLARNLTLWLKTATSRLRPHEWLAHGGGTFFRDGGVAFPSGHVVLCASLALPIAIAYPRARAILVAIPFAMVARMMTGQHFASDVLAGVALSAAVTWLCWVAVPTLPSPRSSPR